MNRTLFLGLVLAAALVVGCEGEKPAETPPADTTTTTTGSASQSSNDGEAFDKNLAGSQLSSETSTPTAPPPQGVISVKDRKPKNGEEVAVLETEKGKIVLMFFPDKAPKHVANFKKLVKSGFYDGTKFHRIIPGFMIQGGDPNTKGNDRSSWGQGGPDERVEAEFNDIHHEPGVLSMARSSDPNSAGSQFFIVVGDAAFLDKQYTAFGKVLTGQDVADKIVAEPAEGELAVDPIAIKKATLAKWPVK
jgi:peptidyl-prolyl cis-trans isomerase B (cyclophilin B)